MKLFVELKKYFKFVGIEPNQNHFINGQNVLVLLIYVLSFCGMVALLLFEEFTFSEFGFTFYGLVSAFVNFISLSSNVLQQTQIFDLIETLEKTIECSKFCNMLLKKKLF